MNTATITLVVSTDGDARELADNIIANLVGNGDFDGVLREDWEDEGQGMRLDGYDGPFLRDVTASYKTGGARTEEPETCHVCDHEVTGERQWPTTRVLNFKTDAREDVMLCTLCANTYAGTAYLSGIGHDGVVRDIATMANVLLDKLDSMSKRLYGE